MKFWLKTIALVATMWLAAAIVIHFAKASQPAATSVTAFVNTTDLNSLQGDARARAIARMEKMMNGLTFDDPANEIDRSGANRHFLHSLTPDEPGAYLDAALPAGFQQLMDSFNKMDPVKRKQIVTDAIARLKEHQGDHEGEGAPPAADSAVIQHVVNQGLKSFYSDANADVKLDLAPLIEQIQVNLRRPWTRARRLHFGGAYGGNGGGRRAGGHRIPGHNTCRTGQRSHGMVSNLNQLGVALHLYLGEHKEFMPPFKAGRQSIADNVPVIDDSLNAYVQDSRVFACPRRASHRRGHRNQLLLERRPERPIHRASPVHAAHRPARQMPSFRTSYHSIPTQPIK